ncbi:MAG TPA: sensor histidine kinase, partial [Candidatus Dormibacteraeota bacterium]|nr:sensor histidine kinase [Candidatus Dormibacteraeota bacterium]
MIDTATSHIVQLYERDECLIDAVARFTAPAFAAGEPMVIIATERHRQGIEAQLLSQHLPLEQARATGRFVALDAVATLAEIMVDGRPDEARFRAVIGSVLARAADGTARVHVRGEMVALLWAAGDREAAIQLEQFWNHLGERLPLSLLCACPSGASADRRDRTAFRRVCDQHEWVVPSEGHRDVGDAEARWRTVADLQQRARAADRLEAERDRVRDTGIGIRADLLPRVFDLFVQAHQALDRTRGGLGIGLTLVKQIV